MDARFSLRFESGERRGETIQVTDGGFTIGRRPGNSLQVLDNSISGRHAEFLIDEQGVTVKDLGSTNGTRVGDTRVLEQRITHGDHVTLGNVEFILLDARLGGAATALEALAKTKEVPGPDGMRRVSADVVARSRRVSRPGLIVVALALVAGGVWWYLGQSSGGKGPTLRAVTPIAGDLLADEASFESDADTWTSADNAPQAFFRSAQARRSGAMGIACELGAREWALTRSREFAVAAGRPLALRAALRASGGATTRAGIEFSRQVPEGQTAPGPVHVWTAPASAGAYEERELAANVPAGYDHARVLVLARAGAEAGGGAADDVSLVEGGSASDTALQVADFGLLLPGPAPASALLVRGDRVLVTGLEFTSAGAPAGWDGAELSATVEGARVRIAPKTARDVLALRCESALAAGGIATIGAEGGFKAHGREFERTGVKDVLLGGKGDLVRLSFEAPVRVVCASEGSAVRLTLSGALAAVTLQLEFKDERKEAGNLAYAARNAEKKGDLGDCLRQWSQLLDTYPYEEKLVEEAEAARARLLEKGLSELRVVRLESERAKFFRLVDLFRQCRERALAIGKRYAGSEVERQARALAHDVDQDLAGLEADLDRLERQRLAAILAALEAQKATGLAAEVREYAATLADPARRAADAPRD